MQPAGRVPVLAKDRKKKRKVNRFFLVMGWIFFLGICLVVFFRSPVSKIDTITIEGNYLTETDQLIQISHLSKGDSFFTINASQIKRDIAALPEVKAVSVTRNFPGKVTIRVEEYKVAAFSLDKAGKIIPILENGKLLEKRPWNDRFIDKPLIRGWDKPELLERLTTEIARLDPAVLNAISEIQPAHDKDPLRLVLYMKDGFEVHTSIQNFAKNMGWYPSFVASLKQEGKTEGIITLLDGKWYVPYATPEGGEGTDSENP